MIFKILIIIICIASLMACTIFFALTRATKTLIGITGVSESSSVSRKNNLFLSNVHFPINIFYDNGIHFIYREAFIEKAWVYNNSLQPRVLNNQAFNLVFTSSNDSTLNALNQDYHVFIVQEDTTYLYNAGNSTLLLPGKNLKSFNGEVFTENINTKKIKSTFITFE